MFLYAKMKPLNINLNAYYFKVQVIKSGDFLTQNFFHLDDFKIKVKSTAQYIILS